MDIKVKWDCPKRTDVIMSIKYLSDSELLERISQKDYNAFNEFWRRYDRFVLSIFHNLLRDKHLAEDSCQRLFMIIWEDSHNYRGGEVKSYLQGIARNIYKEAVRKNTRELPMSSFSGERQEEIMSELTTYQSTDWMSNNGQLIEDMETKIQKFTKSLTKLQRKIFDLRSDNLSWEEIAKIVKTTQGVCRVLHNRVNAKIKEILKEYRKE